MSGIYNSHAENSQYVYFKVNQDVTNQIPRTDFAAELSRICNKKTSHTIILTYLYHKKEVNKCYILMKADQQMIKDGILIPRSIALL